MSKRKFLGTLLNLVTVLFVLGVIAVGALLIVVDPDRYRTPLQQLVAESSGLELELAGAMSLSLRPAIAIRLEDVRLRNPASPQQELASAPLLEIRIQPWPLLKGQLLADSLHIEDLHINWYTDSSGKNLWSTEKISQLGEAPAIDDTAEIQPRIRLVTVSNGSIDIQDHQRQTHYSLDKLNATARGSNTFERAFRLRSDFDFSDGSGRAPQHLLLSSLNQLDLGQGDMSLEELEVTLTPMLLQGDVIVRDLFGNTSISGKLTSNTFHLEDLLDNLRASEDDSTDSLLTAPTNGESNLDNMSLQITFNGDQQQFRIPSLTLNLGETRINSDAVIRFSTGLAPTLVTYNAATPLLDLTPLLQRSDTEPAAAIEESSGSEITEDNTVPVATAPAAQFDTAWLQRANVQGTFRIDSLRIGDFQASFLNVFTNLEDGVLDLETPQITAGAGSLQGNLRIESQNDVALWSLRGMTSDLDMADISLPLLEDGAVLGQLNFETGLGSRGNSLTDVLNNLSGYAGFSVANSLVDIGVVKQVFTAIMALSPTAEPIQQWPDAVPFSQVGGYVVFNNGLGANQDLQLRFDNIDITGSGGVNLPEQRFDYQLLFTVLGEPFTQAVPIGERYRNSAWTVSCSAGFDAAVGQFCRPDFGRAREQFTRLSASPFTPSIENILGRPIPDILPDTVRAMLPGVVQPEF